MDTSKLCDQNQEYKYTIVDLKEKIFNLEKKIKENEKLIWHNCEHEWKKDLTIGQYEKNCYFCKHCKLWRNGHMYN
jgi:hypothetical protein